MNNITIGWLIVAMASVISTLSLVLSVLGLLHVETDDGALISLIVSGFTMVLGLVISAVVLLTTNFTVAIVCAPLILYLFELVSGIVWVIGIVHRAPAARSGEHTSAMIGIFIINEVAASMCLPIALHYFSSTHGESSPADEEHTIGQAASTLNDSTSERKNSPVDDHVESTSEGNTIKSNHSVPVSKKVSERTLVDQAPLVLLHNQIQLHQHNNSQDSKYTDTLKFKHISEESNQLSVYSDFINESINKKPGEYAHFTSDNWMDSGTKLYSLAFPAEIQSQIVSKKPSMQRKTSFGKFMLTSQSVSSLRRGSYTLTNSKSVPTFFKQNRKLESAIPDNSNPKSTKFVEIESSFRAPPSSSTVLAQEADAGNHLGVEGEVLQENNRPISLIKSTSENSIADIINGRTTLAQERQRSQQEQAIIQDDPVKTELDKSVKRSKSASYVGGHRNKMRRREERWKSINDEKIFLSQVNESLLPSVLKTGESHIMELKRQQEHNSLTNSIPSPSKRSVSEAFVDFPPSELCNDFGEIDDNNVSIYDDEDEENLPNISEFGERQQDADDLSDFKGFTQDTLVLSPEDLDYEDEDVDDLQIPKSATYQTPVWKGAEVEKKQKKSYISLQNWNSNSNSWNEERQRNGSSSNNGVIITVSDGEDNVIEGKTGAGVATRRPPFNMSNRSFSAPSLHTFRDFSSNSNSTTSNADKDQQIATASTDMTSHTFVNKNNNLYLDCKTPPVKTENSSSSSPIKKFFQESPRRFSTVFKRQSRQSLEIDPRVFGHQHNGSVASNAFSLGSTKSNSPKKSLKSLLTKKNVINTHRKNASVPSMSFPLKDKKLDIQSSSWYTTANNYSYEYKMRDPREVADALDRWEMDIHPTPTSGQSRVSSVPSAVIGEYDREKWRTLKALENQESIMLNLNEF
ncbi:hypothetical protein CLIB1423_38S00562 [[Candida] railenensis]|uniref:Uncharacterized protein n=1 Tax=[Candida] railenensis TaxID=45579 RepID=A0A9P0W092_9ASCO|nr:hypothetical protein CLIB1423_38S00562 [[Candida] railenensis]